MRAWLRAVRSTLLPSPHPVDARAMLHGAGGGHGGSRPTPNLSPGLFHPGVDVEPVELRVATPAGEDEPHIASFFSGAAQFRENAERGGDRPVFVFSAKAGYPRNGPGTGVGDRHPQRCRAFHVANVYPR